MLPDDPNTLTTADLFIEENAVGRASILASTLINRILRQNQHLSAIIESEISPDSARQALAALHSSESDTLLIAETLHELAAQFAGLLEIANVLVRQRDDALRGEGAFYQRMVDLVAEHQGCSRQQAYKLMLALTNADEALLEADLVDGVDPLIHFRDELQSVLTTLDDDLLVEEN